MRFKPLQKYTHDPSIMKIHLANVPQLVFSLGYEIYLEFFFPEIKITMDNKHECEDKECPMNEVHETKREKRVRYLQACRDYWTEEEEREYYNLTIPF